MTGWLEGASTAMRDKTSSIDCLTKVKVQKKGLASDTQKGETPLYTLEVLPHWAMVRRTHPAQTLRLS